MTFTGFCSILLNSPGIIKGTSINSKGAQTFGVCVV